MWPGAEPGRNADEGVNRNKKEVKKKGPNRLTRRVGTTDRALRRQLCGCIISGPTVGMCSCAPGYDGQLGRRDAQRGAHEREVYAQSQAACSAMA